MKKTLLTATAIVLCLSMVLCIFAGCARKVTEENKEGQKEKTETTETTDTTETTVADTSSAENAGESETTSASAETTVAILSAENVYPEGIEITEYLVIYLAETYNIEMKISNSTENDIYVDFSKLTLKLNNDRQLDETFSTVKIAAGKNVTCSMPIEGDTSDFTKDSFFTVFYDGKLVGKALMKYYE